MASDQPSAAEEPAASGANGPLPFDINVAHQSRMYDYLLGGKDNYAADREVTDAWLKVDPGMAFSARANRAFLGRAVRYLALEAGMRQFLDIGTGIPTAGNTHEVAQAAAPESRVVYVDYDPVVLAHARALLTSTTEAGATWYLDADLRDPGTILAKAREMLDFTRPVAVTLLAILHVIADADDPWAIVARIMDAVPSGSYLVISHGSSDLFDRETLENMKGVADKVREQLTLRPRDQVARFFEGMDLVEPGMVRTDEWGQGEAAGGAGKSTIWCAVARKR
jgi:S-adenosyl methyltransferase